VEIWLYSWEIYQWRYGCIHGKDISGDMVVFMGKISVEIWLYSWEIYQWRYGCIHGNDISRDVVVFIGKISVGIWLYSWESLFYLTILKLIVINARY
jgi:hypothetical protein